ncbi:hypothetical protein [Symmachiella dynata]|nr:hypothetical protein [Symmachiella dynata]
MYATARFRYRQGFVLGGNRLSQWELGPLLVPRSWDNLIVD